METNISRDNGEKHIAKPICCAHYNLGRVTDLSVESSFVAGNETDNGLPLLRDVGETTSRFVVREQDEHCVV